MDIICCCSHHSARYALDETDMLVIQWIPDRSLWGLLMELQRQHAM